MSALLMLGCGRESADADRSASSAANGTRPPSPARSAPGPAALREAMGIPSGARSEVDVPEVTPVASRVLKTTGTIGEWLEGDVYFFKAGSVQPCGDSAATDKLTPTLVGAEVEIRAKSKLTFSPRELRLNGGGIVFNAKVDFDRPLKDCAPQLKVAWLKKDEVIKGFVLFEVPPPEPKNLMLSYQPTRWGGAGYVSVTLPGCVTCATESSPKPKSATPR